MTKDNDTPTPQMKPYSTDETTYRVDAVVRASSFTLKTLSLLEKVSVTFTGVNCESPKSAVRNLAATQGDLLDAACGLMGAGMLGLVARAQAGRAKCERVTITTEVTRAKCERRRDNRRVHPREVL